MPAFARMDNKSTRLEFGTLQIKWEMSCDCPNLMERSCKAFKLIYQLWKIQDLNREKR